MAHRAACRLVQVAGVVSREVAPFGVEVSVSIAAELYREWTDDSRARTFTLDTFDP